MLFRSPIDQYVAGVLDALVVLRSRAPGAAALVVIRILNSDVALASLISELVDRDDDPLRDVIAVNSSEPAERDLARFGSAARRIQLALESRP